MVVVEVVPTVKDMVVLQDAADANLEQGITKIEFLLILLMMCSH